MSSEKSAPQLWLPEQTAADDALFREQSLRGLGPAMRHYPLPKEKYGYPDLAERLFIPGRSEAARLCTDLPAGTWEIGQAEPTAAERTALEARGYTLDVRGRPLNPWLQSMLTNRPIGSLTGRGFLYHWGENETADPLVIASSRILLVLRDNGQWAFPGGFIDEHEQPAATAIREGGEETNLDHGSLPEPLPVYAGPAADMRATAHAWIKTYAFLFLLPEETGLPDIQAGDDALDAGWFPLATARRLALYGSHNAIIERAVSLYPSLALETG